MFNVVELAIARALGRCLYLLVGLGISAALGLAATPASAFSLQRVADFDSPVDIVSIPSAPRLLFVVEKPGVIRVLRNEVTLPVPLLDIRGLVRAEPDGGAGSEEGLLALAFPPDHAKSRLFYVLFVNNDGDIEINEFARKAGPRIVADPKSRRQLLVIGHPDATNHNGGQLHFDRKGLLYASIGDGGNTPTAGDPARRLGSLLGKILRIDPRPGAKRPYRIPRDNPFVGKPGRDEIFAYGLRNPFKFSLEGRFITIADVGQSQQEEVNFLRIVDARGANFGWPQFEGKLIFDADRPGPGPAREPMFVYGRDGGCAIIGGFVVRDPDLPTLAGRYLYADFCVGDLRTFRPLVKGQVARDDKPVGVQIGFPTAFGEGADGQVYVAGSNSLFRLEP
jgi:glucose/arabinose dehydrogenase